MPVFDAASMPLLYLCRHGQTDWNAAGLLQGQSDIPLNSLGRAQAKRNGRYLRNVLGASASDFQFLSSPMDRAMETMRIVRRELGLDPDDFETDERLKEIHFGDWQGFTLSQIGEREPDGLALRKRDKWNFVPPGDGAENYEQLADRVAPVIEGLTRPAIVTAHGGITRAFLRRFAGVSAREAAQADIFQDRILRFDAGVTAWV
ncbi:histidine phosphatase family protein [Aureimonas sp. AU12]|uniref:histidine phosphatase family protein n=1 Tax=Aureimonas sp. AU12 TaxID=1638161 RepID=UPI0009E759E1|nr:histidine phosphatase family protein [Aureimonas sp. AU12]